MTEKDSGGTPSDAVRHEADPSGSFEALTQMLLGATTVAGALQLVVDAAVQLVLGADLVSVTLREPDGTFFTPIQTADIAAELDQVQYNTGRGPCLDASHPDGPGFTGSDDLGAETRWPEFAAAASGHGYGAILSTELAAATPDKPSGALNIYARSRHGLLHIDRHTALLLATHASLALAYSSTTELAELRRTQLGHAIDTRDVIGQAKGVLMSRQGISADEAFELLRRTSQDLNVRLVDVARTLTSRHDEVDGP